MRIRTDYRIVFIAFVVALFGSPASATITVLDYYKLGDADPGAIAGNIGNSTTTDSVAGKNMTREGSPTYSSDVPFSSVGGAPDIFSMSFSGASLTDYV